MKVLARHIIILLMNENIKVILCSVLNQMLACVGYTLRVLMAYFLVYSFLGFVSTLEKTYKLSE